MQVLLDVESLVELEMMLYCTSTTLLFPVDTLKTRWQMGMATPRLDQMYQVHTHVYKAL